jgi:hypothetical protein
MLPAINRRGNSNLHAARSSAPVEAVDRIVAPRTLNDIDRWMTSESMEEIAQLIRESPFEATQQSDRDGFTVLHWCSRNNQKDLLGVLLRRGADPNAVSVDGSAPLHIACKFGSKRCAETLLKYGADPKALTVDRLSPLDLAIRGGYDNIVTLLRSRIDSDGPSPAPIQNHTAPPSVPPPPLPAYTGAPISPNHREQQHLSGFIQSARHSEGADTGVSEHTDRYRLEPSRGVGDVPATVAVTASESRAESNSVNRIRDLHYQGSSVTDVHDLISELMHQNHVLDQQLSSRNVNGNNVLCAVCDEEPKQRAVYICNECRVQGDAFQFCPTCWNDEHRSRRTRHHRRAPIPVVGSALSDTAENASIVDARAVLMIQQQMLQLLKHFSPKPSCSSAVQTDVSGESTSRSVVAHGPTAAELKKVEVELEKRSRELQDQRHFVHQYSREASLNYQLSIEMEERLCIVLEEQQSYTELVFTHIELLAFSIAAQYSQFAFADGDRPTSAVLAADFEVVEGTGEVEAVLGEKQLPGQPRMLLIKWRSHEDEEWVAEDALPAEPIVVAYLRRQSFRDTFPSRPQSQLDRTALSNNSDGAPSPLQEAERAELNRQLASLKRVGTAPSRDGTEYRRDQTPALDGRTSVPSLAEPAAIAEPAAAVPIRLGHSFGATPGRSPNIEVRRIESVSPDPDVIPMPPSEDQVPHDLQASPGLEDEVDAAAERIRQLEAQHRAIKLQREEHERELQRLKEKQQLRDQEQRKRVHKEYEAQQNLLQEEQPHLNHPLTSTNDRHAALLLHKLQEEIALAEKEREIYNEYRKGAHLPPPPPAQRPTVATSAKPAVESKQTLQSNPANSTPPPVDPVTNDTTSPKAHPTEPQRPPQPPEPAPAPEASKASQGNPNSAISAPPVSQKQRPTVAENEQSTGTTAPKSETNSAAEEKRMLYERYFYNYQREQVKKDKDKSSLKP